MRVEGRRTGASLGLTGACCRPGAGRRPGSPLPKSSPSRDAPWQPGSPIWNRVHPAGIGGARLRPAAHWPHCSPASRGSKGGIPSHPPPRDCTVSEQRTARGPSRTLVPAPRRPPRLPGLPLPSLRQAASWRGKRCLRWGRPCFPPGWGLNPLHVLGRHAYRRGLRRRIANAPSLQSPDFPPGPQGDPEGQTVTGGRRI